MVLIRSAPLRHFEWVPATYFCGEIRKISCRYPLIWRYVEYQENRIFDWQKLVLIQSTLVISNSMGNSEILRDIRTSTYQIYRIEEKIIRTTTFNKYICNWTLEVRDILKILWKRGEIVHLEQFLLFSTMFFFLFLPVVRFSCLGSDQIFSSR